MLIDNENKISPATSPVEIQPDLGQSQACTDYLKNG
jgi:hypothetical protein